MSTDYTNFDRVYDAMQEHAWQHTYYTHDDPMECYCGARMKEHDFHLAAEILKALGLDS